ncbi:TPA: helix-turn-helix domain-containing protein [Stenotrophomonas maltophilia]|nr:helix-turn-helix domain-containing protein [Stenotrophomonas maltophilia]
MNKPDASQGYDSSSAHTRALIQRTGLTYAAVAQRLGCSVRSLERWAGQGGSIPYPEHYLLECLADRRVAKPAKAARKPKGALPAKPHPLAGLLGR